MSVAATEPEGMSMVSGLLKQPIWRRWSTTSLVAGTYCRVVREDFCPGDSSWPFLPPVLCWGEYWRMILQVDPEL
jgi:hypothetical protein